MSDDEISGSNRRVTFRADDTVTLRVRVLDELAEKEICEDFNAYRMLYCMKSHMQNEKEVRKPKLIRIRRSDPDIASYLEAMEVQIAQLAERLDQASDSSRESIEFTTRVNLSATGIRFRTDIPLSKGQVVEIGMVLSTQNTKVLMLGKILRVEDRPDNKIAASLDYSHIHPEDTEAIIRHLAKLQQFDLQARRGVG